MMNKTAWHTIDAQLLPTLREETLESFGFVKQAESTVDATEYIYETPILDGEFIMKIRAIAKQDEPKQIQISTLVVDSKSGEPYFLHCVRTAQGAFVGKVRQAHREVIQKFEDHCGYREYDIEYFFTAMSYILRKYRDRLEYPFDKGTEAAIVRSHKTLKWYAVIMTIMPQKIGLTGNRKIKVMNLHGSAEEVAKLIDGKRFFAGFHMNKKYWYTIKLDGSIALKELYQLIDKSYAMTKHRKKRRKEF